MARSWQYPRWRRMLMQAILLMVLAATAGLAELVSRQRNREEIPELKQVQKIDRVIVKLPAGWDVTADDTNGVIAQEPGVDGQGRIMAVRLLHSTKATSAAEFLARSGLLNPNGAGGNPEDDEPDGSIAMNTSPVMMRPISMAGYRGVLARVVVRERSLPDLSSVTHNQLIAAVVLPSRSVIVAQLDSSEPDVNGDDEKLLEQVAAALKVTGEKQP